jgi:hypothetical protein
MDQAPSLWFDLHDITRVQEALAYGEPHATGILELARATVAGRGPEGAPVPAACAIVAAVDGDPAAAAKGLAWIAEQAWPKADLGLAALAFRVAVVSEGCAPLWSAADRARVRDLLRRIALGLRQVRGGNPHTVTNNWWAITHSAGLIAALAAGTAEDPELGRIAEFHLQRLLAFCQHFGPEGLYHEGLGYQGYTCSHLVPALEAARRLGLADAVAAHPGLARMARTISTFTAPRPVLADDRTESHGSASLMSWNDAGFGWWSDGTLPILIGWSDPAERGMLRSWYDRLSGMHSRERLFGPGWEGWLFALFRYPYGTVATDPAALPRFVCDGRQGLVGIRDRWRDGDDTILGCYARSTHAGGHSHDDAGSIRLSALGRDWIAGGGQARGEPQWQSKMTAVEPPAGRKASLGAVMWAEGGHGAGIVGIDLRRDTIGYHERWIAADFTGALGMPAVLVLDLIDDHLARSWDWNLSAGPGIAVELGGDGRSFAFRNGDATLSGWFAGAASTGLRVEAMPASKRTYSHGETVQYPGRPYLALRLPHAKPLAIAALLIPHRGPAPAVAIGDDLAVTINGRRWERPFGDALAPAFRLSVGGGTCPHPGGIGFAADARGL